MENLWPNDLNNLKPFDTPKNILEKQSEYLLSLTDGAIYTSVEEGDEGSRRSAGTDFCYTYNIVGKFLNGYTFEIMTMYHDLAIYPLSIDLDEQIAEELNIYDNYGIEIYDESYFKDLLKRILSTKKVNHVLRSILSLSNQD